MKKLIYTIFLVVAFQFAQGQEVLSINYYNPDNQQQIPLENLTLVLPEGDNFNFPMIAVLKNTGTQIISTGDTIFTKINFNGRNINVFFAI
ncbi:hypothetical protein LJB75_01440, partial [Bacteroidales bacterium OttesenSCG-928-L19]|nr:hypothetical protein [Bacteroidales bacterium OttesenSCG-928-L19]